MNTPILYYLIPQTNTQDCEHLMTAILGKGDEWRQAHINEVTYLPSIVQPDIVIRLSVE